MALGAHDRAGACGVDVLLPDVDAVRACREGEVGPVVEDERHLVGVADVAHHDGPRHHRIVVQVLLAELHDVDTPEDACVDERLEVGAVGRAEIKAAAVER